MPGKLSDIREICVIHGLGGIGKTQLAIAYARLHKAEYTSFFWLDGKTEESLIQSLLTVASRVPRGQIPGMEAQKKTGLEESRKAAQEVLKWFALEDNKQWLLVFDNIDKTSYEEESAQHTYDITQYFPRDDNGSIIITTRLPRLVSLGKAVHLRKLNVLDSLQILEEHTGLKLNRRDNQTASTEVSGIEEWDAGRSFVLRCLFKEWRRCV